MPELSERAKPIIQKVFDRAYLEQATGSEPWGISESGICSYKAGCAIGRSLPAELAEQMGGTIQSAHDLTWRDQNREFYKQLLEDTALRFGLTLPEPATKEQ